MTKSQLRVKQICLPMLGKQVFKNQLVILNRTEELLPSFSIVFKYVHPCLLYLLFYDTFFQLLLTLKAFGFQP